MPADGRQSDHNAAAPMWSTTRIDLPGIEGFRAIAALTVLFYHAYLAKWWETADRVQSQGLHKVTGTYYDNLVGFGHTGVVLFFVISGLVLFLPFAQRTVSHRPAPDIRRYAQRRLLRIFPAYLAVLGIAALVFGFSVNAGNGLGILVSNMFLVQAYHVDTPNILGVAWTLPVELGFYALLPVLAFAAGKLANRRGISPWAAMTAVVAVSMAFTQALRFLRHNGEDLQVGFVPLGRTILVHLDAFAVGMLIAIVYLALVSGALNYPRRILPGMVSTLAAGFLAAGTVLPASRYGWDSSFDFLCAVAFGLLILRVLVWPDRGTLSMLTRHRIMIWLGLISYSIYLWHTVVLRMMRNLDLVSGTGGVLPLAITTVAAALVTVILSAATYYGVERVYMRSQPRKPLPLAQRPQETDIPGHDAHRSDAVRVREIL